MAYYEEGTIGLGAKIDIPPNKAFLFVPFSLIITAKRAKSSEISSIFQSHPYYFSGHEDSEFDIVLVYLIYEKSKGPSSAWSSYFEAIGDLELLSDWSEHDLSQLNDPLLVFSVQELSSKIEEKFKLLSEVFEEHSDVFPSGTLLKQHFDWSYRVLLTRAFNYGELRLVPMADFMNFSNNSLVFEDFDKEALARKAGIIEKDSDYRDFLGNPVKGQGSVKETARYLNRIDRFLNDKADKSCFKGLKTVWELERLLVDYESSDDEEEVNIVQYYEEEEDNPEITESEADNAENNENNENLGEDFLVVSTDEYSGVKQGAQITFQIRTLTNRDWLLNYAVSIENNWFESFYLLLWSSSLASRLGPVPVEDLRSQSYKSEFPNATVTDVTDLVILKSSVLNLDLLKYFRKNLDYRGLSLQEPQLKVSPSDLDVELHIIEAVTSLLGDLEGKGPPVAQDLNLLHRNLPRRLKFAVIYRVGQKKIIARQIAMLQQLKHILISAKESGSLENHLNGKSLKEVSLVYGLRKYLRSLYGNLKNKSL